MTPAFVLPRFSAPPVVDLEAADEADAIRKVAALLKGDGDVSDHAAFLAAVEERQRLNPPLLGEGIALPHARTPAVKEIVFTAARLREPVPFGAEKLPVKLIFLFGVPPRKIGEYLTATAALARCLRQPATITKLLAAEGAEAFRACLE
jgi:mannitol/fructose-specific phosphotransferase system IIA component (Ntr-type)